MTIPKLGPKLNKINIYNSYNIDVILGLYLRLFDRWRKLSGTLRDLAITFQAALTARSYFR